MTVIYIEEKRKKNGNETNSISIEDKIFLFETKGLVLKVLELLKGYEVRLILSAWGTVLRELHKKIDDPSMRVFVRERMYDLIDILGNEEN